MHVDLLHVEIAPGIALGTEVVLAQTHRDIRSFETETTSNKFQNQLGQNRLVFGRIREVWVGLERFGSDWRGLGRIREVWVGLERFRLMENDG